MRASAIFFARHPVFSVDQANRAWKHPRGKAGTVERLKHHLGAGRLKRVTREIYAAVPAAANAAQFRPDRFLVASTIRPEGVFAYHSALELLGVGHSSWNRCTLLVERRRRPLSLDGTELRFLGIPKPMRESRDPLMGTRRIEYRGRLLRVTGPERTLVEGMGRLDLCGGPEEHVVSASGFPTLDLDLLLEVLRCYRQQLLWAAVGWFLERYQEIFHVPDAYLERLARRRPRTPRYLERNSRGGRLLRRWNLIVPEELECSGGPREP